MEDLTAPPQNTCLIISAFFKLQIVSLARVSSFDHIYSPVRKFQKGSTEPKVILMLKVVREPHSILGLVGQG